MTHESEIYLKIKEKIREKGVKKNKNNTPPLTLRNAVLSLRIGFFSLAFGEGRGEVNCFYRLKN
jgi:hypothetical protein